MPDKIVEQENKGTAQVDLDKPLKASEKNIKDEPKEKTGLNDPTNMSVEKIEFKVPEKKAKTMVGKDSSVKKNNSSVKKIALVKENSKNNLSKKNKVNEKIKISISEKVSSQSDSEVVKKQKVVVPPVVKSVINEESVSGEVLLPPKELDDSKIEGQTENVVLAASVEEAGDEESSIPPREIYIVEKIVNPEALLLGDKNADLLNEKDKKAIESILSNDKNKDEEIDVDEQSLVLSSVEDGVEYEGEPVVISNENNREAVVGAVAVTAQENLTSVPEQLQELTPKSIIEEKVDYKKDTSDKKNDSAFVVIKQGDNIEKVPATKVDADDLTASLDVALSLSWEMITPNDEQRRDQRFAYCYRILKEIRQKKYRIYSPYKVSANDYDHWQQKLGEISLVQLLGQSLNFYQIKSGQNNLINVVQTVFQTDAKLSEMLVGIQKRNYFFSGVLSFGENSQQSLGGVGRFHGVQSLDRFLWYVIEWDKYFYAIRLHKKGSGYDLMEIIPLLYQQQKMQRNCRWENMSS